MIPPIKCVCGRYYYVPKEYWWIGPLDDITYLTLYNMSGWVTLNCFEKGFIETKSFCPECLEQGKDKIC